MGSALVQFRIDDNEKLQAIAICNKLGMNLPSYLRMCTLRLVQEKGVPFSMKVDTGALENPGVRAMKRASQIAEECGIADMSLDEINEEIAAVRR